MEDAVDAAEDGLAVIQNVPRETDSWLELFLLAVKSRIRWEYRVPQEDGVGRLARRREHARKNLRFPAQPITQTQVVGYMPFVLRQQMVVHIVNTVSTGLNVDQNRL